MNAKKKPYKKIALTLSLCLIVLWALLGTGASLAWFTDTSGKVENIFHVAEFELSVSYRTENGNYEEITSQTKVFDENALYEPGYVQVIYLKAENRGEVPFDFKTAVGITDYTPAINVFGTSFNLQDYLKFGLVTGATEAEVETAVSDRETAKSEANMALSNYSTDIISLDAKDELYMALIVRMPEEVGNDANYRGNTAPKVELGLIFSATQQ